MQTCLADAAGNAVCESAVGEFRGVLYREMEPYLVDIHGDGFIVDLGKQMCIDRVDIRSFRFDEILEMMSDGGWCLL